MLKFDETQLLVYNDRFRYECPEDGISEKTPHDTFHRVATILSSKETNPSRWYEKFMHIMEEGLFCPAGRILANAGTRNNNCFNCFVLPIEDSLDSIFTSIKEMAIIQSRGGGTGWNFSTLRPIGDRVKGTNNISTGVCSFISAHNDCSNIIESGSRRAANMALLDISHPEIEDFIKFKKNNPGKWERFNVSVVINQKFLDCVDRDGDWELTFGGKVYRRVKAKELWRLVCEYAHAYGDPGIIDLEFANTDFDYPLITGKPVIATNPCSEKIMHAYDQCDLGSINLFAHVRNPSDDTAYFDWNKFGETIDVAVRLLDNVYDVSDFPLPQNKDFGLKHRRIGLGVMGYADACMTLGIKYSESKEFTSKLMEFMATRAFLASSKLAGEKGANCIDPELYVQSPYIKRVLPESTIEHIRKHGIRNLNVVSLAPTGTISMFYGVSSGIEPVFQFEYLRKDGLTGESRKVKHPVYEMCTKKSNFLELYSKGVFQTALDLSPEQHLEIHGTFAPYVDSNISKTVNLPNSATVEDVDKAFRLARKYGIKSTTVFRTGSRNGVLTPIADDICEKCGSKLVTDANCKSCPNCGRSKCEL